MGIVKIMRNPAPKFRPCKMFQMYLNFHTICPCGVWWKSVNKQVYLIFADVAYCLCTKAIITFCKVSKWITWNWSQTYVWNDIHFWVNCSFKVTQQICPGNLAFHVRVQLLTFIWNTNVLTDAIWKSLKVFIFLSLFSV